MATGPNSWTYTVEINGGPPQAMTVASSLTRSAAAAVPAIFDVDQGSFPLHIKIWVEDHVSEDDPPNEWLIFEPGGVLCSLVTDSEGGMHSVTGLGPYFGALAHGPADLRDYLASGRTVWRQDGQPLRRCAV